MAPIVVEVDITRPPDEVFRYVTDASRFGNGSQAWSARTGMSMSYERGLDNVDPPIVRTP